MLSVHTIQALHDVGYIEFMREAFFTTTEDCISIKLKSIKARYPGTLKSEFSTKIHH